MWAPWTGAFVDRLKALGWIDGQTVRLEFRWAEGKPELITPLAQEFARLNPNVIIGGANDVAGTRAIRKEIPTTPIIFFANDPLGSGLVNSLARPSGNMTGISLQTLDLANKRFELLRETVPNIHRLAVMANANIAPTTLEMNTVQELARKFEIDPIPLEIRRAEDIESAFAKLKTEQVDALIRRDRCTSEYQSLGYRKIGGSGKIAGDLWHSRLGPFRRTHVLWVELSGAFRAYR
jgi:putative tryptophan/tyrosine transport system substrate-binding protein